VVGGDRVIQDLDIKPPARLVQPIGVTLSDVGKFQQKLFLVAAVRNVPDMPWQKATIRSRHKRSPLRSIVFELIGLILTR
jgi:hypothetical protein